MNIACLKNENKLVYQRYVGILKINSSGNNIKLYYTITIIIIMITIVGSQGRP